MDLGYHKTVEISTNDLPYVNANIELVFGFRNDPALWFAQSIREWGRDCDKGAEEKAETTRLAAHLLQYVRTPDNESYQLGDEESIKVLINETSYELVTNVMAGWLTYTATQRMANKKKSLTPLLELRDKNGRKSLVKE